MHNIKIEPLTDKDNLVQISNIFNLLYPQRPIKKDYVLWRYIDTPFESKTYVIKDNNKIVGSYSGCIFEGFINGKKGKIGLLYDLMISPKYQNHGLVLPLYKALFTAMVNEKPNFLYAFVNRASLSFYTEYLKWNHLKEVCLYFNKTRKLKKLLENMNLNLVDLRYSESLEKNITSLANAAYKEEKLQTFVERSYKFLKWRSRKVFGKDFKLLAFHHGKKLVGFCIYKSFADKTNNETVVDLIDIIAYPKDYLYRILYIICTILERSKIQTISTFGFGQLNKEVQLKKIGFEKSKITWTLITESLTDIPKSDFYINMLDMEMF